MSPPDPTALSATLRDDGRMVRDGRVIHVAREAHTRVDRAWSFGEEAFAADVVAFLVDGQPYLWIPIDELQSVLPDLHPAGDGWQLVVRQGRLFTAEWALREDVGCWTRWPG